MHKKYVTTPIYYPNGSPHIGHLYSTVLADVWRKTAQLFNVPAFFSTGVDEHGQKVAQKAAALGRGTQEHVDILSQEFIEFFHKFGIRWDFWSRTTNANHQHAAQHMWRVMEKNGYIYKGTYSGWYHISDENYLSAEEKAQYKEDDPNIVLREEECYYFKLSALEKKLISHYKENPDCVFPKKRYNEVIGFLEQGLKDFVISRPKERLSWGIPVPGDEAHVMYVWVDALANYLSNIGYPEPAYKNYWPGTHILGKDILKFHAIYWPAMLVAAGADLPTKLLIHGWWLKDDAKISKSLQNAEPLEHLIATYQTDGIRYFLLKGVTLGEDGQFSEELIKTFVYGDLANKFGNMFLRLIGIVEIGFHGKLHIPKQITKETRDETLDARVAKLYKTTQTFAEDVTLITDYVQNFLDAIIGIGDYFQQHEVWKITDDDEKASRIYYLFDLFRKITILASPILPNTAEQVMKFLGLNGANLDAYEKKIDKIFATSKPEFFPKPKNQ